jgi:hypothetical protein
LYRYIQELPTAAAVSLATAAAERSAWRRHVITTHHQTLRARCAGGGSADDDAATAAAAALEEGSTLRDSSGTQPVDAAGGGAQPMDATAPEATATTTAWIHPTPRQVTGHPGGADSDAAGAAAAAGAAGAAGGGGERAWREAVGEEAQLRDYAEAAEEVGNRAWVGLEFSCLPVA